MLVAIRENVATQETRMLLGRYDRGEAQQFVIDPAFFTRLVYEGV
jgi:hypothetical protein